MFKTMFLLAVTALTARADDSGPFSPLTFQNGVSLAEPSGRFSLGIRFRMQNLVTVNSASANGTATVTGQVRRLRLRLFGNVVSPTLFYTVQLSFSRDDMDWANTSFPNIVRDATLLWRPSNWYQLSFGQTKLPGNRQRVVSSGEMQFVDRSIVNRGFNLDRDFGVQAALTAWEDTSPLHLRLAVSTGEGRNNVNPDTGLCYTARVEFLPLGPFAKGGDYSEADLVREPRPKLSVGAGGAFNARVRRSGGQVGRTISEPRDLTTWFVDVMGKYNGTSFYAEWMARHAPNPLVSNAANDFVLTGYGLNLQIGHFVAEEWEIVARASWVKPAPEVVTVSPDLEQHSLGVNWYIAGHRAKLQSDVSLNAEKTVPATRLTHWMIRTQIELGI